MSADLISLSAARGAKSRRKAGGSLSLLIESTPGQVSLALSVGGLEALASLTPDEAESVADDLRRAAVAARRAKGCHVTTRKDG